MKKFTTTFCMLSIAVVSFAQTFCLQISEISNDGSDYVVALEIQSSTPFQLGSGNLQFVYPDNALGDPTMSSSILAPPQYFNPTITMPFPGAASLNIELAFPGFGLEITDSPEWTELAQISFPINDAGSIVPLSWSYNGGTTQTVVYADDEATQLFATSTDCLIFSVLEEDIIRLSKVDPTTNEITITNLGGTTVDISDWRLCSNFNYTFSGMDGDAAVAVVSGDFNLSPDEAITLSWTPGNGFREEGDDIGLYFPAGGFALAASMADFVQYLSAGNGRESVAVEKGIWTTGEFVENEAPYNFVGGATDFGVEFWQGQVIVVPGCMDAAACNYNDEATTDNGSCVFASACDTCSGETDGSGVVIDNPEVGDSCDDGDENTFDDVIVSCGLCSGQLCDPEVAIIEVTSPTVFCTDDEIDDTFTFNVIGGSGENALLFATELDGTILAALDVEPIDFNLSNDGEYLIYHMFYDGSPELVGGDNIAHFVGCFVLSEPIAISVISGDDCVIICEASAVISGDISICEGELADIVIDFEGTAPWTFIAVIDGANLASITTSDNPYVFSTATVGSYTLMHVDDANCVGTVSGKATVTEYDSPIISNVVATSLDQVAYYVTFDIIGGDPSTYINTGNTGTFTGNVFTSDPLPCGTPYSFTVTDGNDCNPAATAGSFDCPEIFDCPELGLNIGDECDDGNDDLIPGIVNEDCECVSVEVDCLELGLNIGDECDDGNDDLIPGIVNEDCECVSTEFDCLDLELNIGDVCDDNDPETEGDLINDDCICEGTVGIADLSDNDSELIIYPNPAQNELIINFQLKEAGQITFEIFDVLGSQVKRAVKSLNSGDVTHSLNTESLTTGMYIIRISNDENTIAQKFSIVR